jgi:hypothetical protein
MSKEPKNNKAAAKRPIEQYDHKKKKRLNNPPVGLVTAEADKEEPKKKYSFDPHLDPLLVWAGKKERTSFEVPSVSLHVHERIDPRTIIEAVKRKNGGPQMSLFQTPDENPPLREAVEFYKHKHGWSNRLIAGDSLLVMNSLLEKEGTGRTSPDGVLRSTIRHPTRRGPHRRAGDDKGLQGYLGTRHSFLYKLSSRPPSLGARTARRVRVSVRANF